MIFIQNKYTNWYNNIITTAQARTLPKNIYIERHHIIPRSLGGNNEQSNLVKLTAREHFVCHLLLTKMTIGRMRYKMSKALTMIMSIRRVGDRTNYSITSKWYEPMSSCRFILYNYLFHLTFLINSPQPIKYNQ